MRILFDTNILLRAIQSGSPAREALLLATTKKHILISAEFIIDELRRAFTYPRVRSRIPLMDEQIAAYVDDVRRNSVIVDPEHAHLSTPIPCRDPDDVPVIKSAVAGHADVLCTLDNDIRRDVVASWCLQLGIHILTDVELLHVLRTQEEPDTD
jgi:putative PIN family toxin of toxin-antitoxin system